MVLKLFASVVQSGKMDRALDLIDRLHLEKSYELAIKLSSGHHRLMDSIEDAKDRKFGRLQDDTLADTPEYTTRRDDDFDVERRITPDARPLKRALVNDPAHDARQVRNRQVY